VAARHFLPDLSKLVSGFDIRGMIERLPYLKALGVDAVWLSPIFPSPMVDFGYDRQLGDRCKIG
jgi:glycosidase